MDITRDQVARLVQTAVAAHRAGNTTRAVESYQGARRLIDATLRYRGADLRPEERAGLLRYSAQLTAHIDALSASSSGVEEVRLDDDLRMEMTEAAAAVDRPSSSKGVNGTAPSSRPVTTPPPAAAAPTERRPRHPESSTPPASGTGGAKGITPTPPASGTGGAKGITPTPAQPSSAARPQGRKGYMPKASTLVLKAVEMATQYMQGAGSNPEAHKRAIDVLQHALDDARDEENLPSNMREVEALCIELRQKYCATFKPRLLQDNPILPDELEVLRRAGTTSRLLLPMWDDINEGFPRENVYFPCKTVYTDPFVPELCPEQKKRGAVFVRPWVVQLASPSMQHQEPHPSPPPPPPTEEAVVEGTAVPEEAPTASSGAALVAGDAPSASCLEVVAGSMEPHRVRQSVVADCSFVCSLVLCASIQERFPGASILGGVIHPQRDGKPDVSKHGKYAIKMLVNGTTRMIVVDDRLPAAPSPPPGSDAPPAYLCTHSANPNELWPALMEKAFIKVCGGNYDWAGSNSASDLYMIAGWLPDSLQLPGSGGGGNAHHFDAELQWKRICLNIARGAVAITAQTPSLMQEIVRDRLGLVPEHAYAVLDAKEVDSYRLVKVRNPWAAHSWKGLFSIADRRNCTPEMLAKLGFSEAEATNGVFWMTWQDMCLYFASLSLSWNPMMLYPTSQGLASRPTRLATHMRFDYSESYLLLPQVHLRVSAEVPPSVSRRVHLVFARHITDEREYAEETRKSGQRKVVRPFIALHVYDTTPVPSHAALAAGPVTSRVDNSPAKCYGRRVQGCELPSELCVYKGAYRNSANQTVSFTAAEGYRDYTVVVSQLLEEVLPEKPQPFTFSLTAHTGMVDGPRGMSLRRIPYVALPNHSIVAGSWVKGATCGGRCSLATSVYNPQYTFSLVQPSRLIATLVTPSKLPVALHIVRHPDDARPDALPWARRVGAIGTAFTVVLRSGAYNEPDALIDSSLSRCVSFMVDTNDEAQPQPPPPGAPPPPVPECNEETPGGGGGVLPLLVAPPRIDTDGPPPPPPEKKLLNVGPPCPALMKRPASLLPFVAAVSFGRLASPQHSQLLYRGETLDAFSTPLGALLSRCGLQPWGGSGSDAAAPLIVVPGTDTLPRTPDLAREESALSRLAACALDTLSRIPVSSSPADRRKLFAPVDEGVTQALLRLDASHTPTPEIAVTRKALVSVAQQIHDLVDAVVDSATDDQPQPPPTAAQIHPSGGIVPAGCYTVLCSAWNKGQPGSFRLSVEAEEPLTLAAIPPEGQGWNALALQVLWKGATAEGQLHVKRSCAMVARALHVTDGVVSEDSEDPQLTLTIVDASTGNIITSSNGGVAAVHCAIPYVKLAGSKTYTMRVSSPTAQRRGSVVVRCFTDLAGAAVIL